MKISGLVSDSTKVSGCSFSSVGFSNIALNTSHLRNNNSASHDSASTLITSAVYKIH